MTSALSTLKSLLEREPSRWEVKFSNDVEWLGIGRHRVEEFRADGDEVRALYALTEADLASKREVVANAERRSSPSMEGRGMVKPLEWEHAPNHSWQHYAKTAVGYYCASDNGTEELYLDRDRDIIGGRFKSLDEAKAAAQADYERRILSALASPSGQEDIEALRVENERLRKALVAIIDRSRHFPMGTPKVIDMRELAEIALSRTDGKEGRDG